MDKTDKNIIRILKKSKKANKQTLWIKSFSREGVEVFGRRLNRLEKEGEIDIDFGLVRGINQYVITLGKNYGKQRSKNIGCK